MLVSQHNPAMQDIASALTSSLDRDGKGGMRANLPMNGNKITGLEPGTASTDAATVGQISTATSIPLGAVIDYWGATPPDGYLFCAGQAVSRSTYADLFAVIGTAAGAGDGSTTFNLPDYRGRIGAGRDNMNGSSAGRLNTLSSTTLGASGGSQTHTLTEAELAAHDHEITDPGHTHTSQQPSGSSSASTGGVFIFNDTNAASTSSATTGIEVDDAGGGDPHNNVQPTIICNKIMRAF